jgi:acetoin utilization protein AcuB
LSEIARICETNDVLILNLQIKAIPDEDVMQIILKTNTKDLGAVQAAFNRYEYNNVAVIDGDLNTNSFVQERYDMLMSFLKL